MDMTRLRRLLLTAALPAAGLVAVVGVAAAVDAPRTAPAASVPESTGAGVPTSGVSTVVSAPGDISGPCDEAEHADDPRCTGAGGTAGTTGVTTPATTPSTSPSRTPSTIPSTTATSTPGDISGPCDEAEHVDDPRCTGVDDDDNSGSGNRDDHRGDRSNRGPGGGGDDDNRGPGGGGDDNRGPGGGDD